jgi:hypothetical protein
VKKYVFMLTYNEQDLWVKNYPKKFVDKHFKPYDFHFIVLDNGNQPLIREWCEQNHFTYYASEYNIGSSGGYNWAFKIAYSMNLDAALFMQADVEVSNSRPLLLTFSLTQVFSEKYFLIWPQELHGFEIDHQKTRPWMDQARLHNLGNLVGFNSLSQFKHDCYFDENFVVTHCDDFEFITWLQTGNRYMSVKNTPAVLNHGDHLVEIGENGQRIFVIKGPKYVFKVHHASQSIEKLKTGENQFHNKWFDFNQPYFLSTQTDLGIIRKPYDPSRWTRFGYPPYPVLHEINRFFKQYPELNVNGIEPWKIPNE